MEDLSKPIEIIFKRCFQLKENESVLILIDDNYNRLGKLFFKEAKSISKAKVDLVKMPELKISGAEPSPEIADKMLEYDIIVILTMKSLSHTKARKKACDAGARIASMPTFNEDMLKRCIDIDYEKMNILTNKVCDMLDSANNVKIEKNDGTSLTLCLKGRNAHGRHSGIITKKGEYSNLPDGEAFIAPVEGTANGTLIIDGSVASVGKLNSNIKALIKGGFAVDISGNIEALKFKKNLESAGKMAFNVAELGIGLNPKAIITGNILEDEKVISTIHIAFGNNASFGGNVKVPIHLDCIIKSPDVYLDEKLLMKSGKFLF